MVAAWLQGNVHQTAAGPYAGLLQGGYLGMVGTRRLRITLSDNFIIIDYYCADRRVGTDLSQS